MGVINAAEEETIKRAATRSRPARFDSARASETATQPPMNDGDPTADQPEWIQRLYQQVDQLTGGHAEGVMRLVSFLIIGGSASIVNLVCVAFMDHFLHPRPQDKALYLTISAISTEISLVFNYALNDRFTFRALVDKRRTWLQRCIRFHGPAAVGFFLTLAISATAFTFIHHAVISQAIAIVIVTGVNFIMHRYWTYRATHHHPELAR